MSDKLKSNPVNNTGRVRTRFAPSPTGNLHIGGLRTSLFNYLFSKKHGGDFILRIEDTDRKRFVEGAEDYIRESLDWVGITLDESPWNPNPDIELYRQSERAEAGIYDKYVKKLIDEGKAYYAFDTPEELNEAREAARASKSNFSYNAITRQSMRNSFSLSEDEVNRLIDEGHPYVIRFNCPRDLEVRTEDLIRGHVKFNSNVMDDKVLVKADGIPTYHMANIVDDYEMGITHVIRGEEWLPSVPLHLMLYDALELPRPTFCHLPLILNPNGKGKLSKRSGLKNGFSVFPLTCQVTDKDGEVHTMEGYKEQGYEPGAFINFLALLGWTPNDDKEVLSLDEMVEDFDMGRVSKAGCKFSLDKANWFNSKYVNKLTLDEVFEGRNTSGWSNENLEKVSELAKERAVFRKDLDTVLNIFFKGVESYNNTDQLNESFKDTFSTFIDTIDSADITFKVGQDVKDYIYKVGVKDKGHKFRDFMPGLRQALTGGVSGPDLMTTMTILGKDESINRIKKALTV